MDVVRENFGEVFQIFEKELKQCDFIAVDTELTGIYTNSQSRPKFLDSPEEHYSKFKESARNFFLVQYGVCLCRWIPEENKFVASPFNFNIFPSTYNHLYDRCLLSQPSSLTFLAKNKFDFNKWVYEGIPYLSKVQEEDLRQNGLPFKNKQRVDVVLKEEDKCFLKEVFQSIDNWLTSEKSHDPLLLEPCNSYKRRIIYQELPKKYQNLKAETMDKNSVKFIQIHQPNEQNQQKEEEVEQQQRELEFAIGFRRIVDLISESRKLVVGHNLFLDLVHTLDKFRNPPPLVSVDFKKQIQEMFPLIIDTKILATRCLELQELFSVSSLGNAFDIVSQQSFGGPLIDYGNGFKSKEIPHQAGYDAYMTGFLFIKMAYKLQEILQIEKNGKYPIGQWLEICSSYINVLHMTGSDCSFNLAGEDDIPDRSNIFYAYEFPVSTTTWNLIEFFNQYGKLRIQWIDETSAFLVFGEKIDQVSMKKILTSQEYKVIKFEEYCKKKQQEQILLASPEVSRHKRKRIEESGVLGIEDKEEEGPSPKRQKKGVHFPEFCSLI